MSDQQEQINAITETEKLGTDIEDNPNVQPPGGKWSERHPTFSQTVKSLARRSWLVKIRDAGTIASEIIATVLFAILAILWNFASSEDEEIINAPILTAGQLFDKVPEKYANVTGFDLTMAYLMQVSIAKGGNFVAHPNIPTVRKMINDYYGASLIPVLNTKGQQTGEYVNLSQKFTFVDTNQELRDNFNEHEAYGTGLGFLNELSSPTDSSWIYHLNLNIYEVNDLAKMFVHNLKAAMYQDFGGNGKVMYNLTHYLAAVVPHIPPNINLTTGFDLPDIRTQRFSRPVHDNEMPINIAVAFFAAIPVVIATMPDLTMVLTDKESKMMTFIFLMGAPESAYWLVSFVSSFLMCLIPYIVMDILLCTCVAMKGTNFVLLFILNILFILAQICFQFFLSAFFTTAGTGRVLTVIFLILIIFFGYLNEVYTLDADDAVKHVLSLIPIECYEMMISVMYEEVRNKREAFGFSQFTKGLDTYRYPVYYCFIWLIVDIILWGGLFILFNATLDRGFGAPPLSWSDLFHCNFKRAEEIELNDIQNEQSIMKVDHLVKRYRGKQINAVDDVSFDIKKGEIIVMIGPNGAGKSSIINTVSGAIPATDGTLTLGDKEPSKKFQGIQDCLGIVFQDNVIINLLSIQEHLEIFGSFRGIDKQVLQDAIDFFADNLQLKEMLPNRAGDLSGGQKRKLCIALALLGNPPIIIMDEPTAGVDVQARQLIWKSISNLKDSTCIITTHALEEAEAVSSRMFVISRGKIPFAGTSTELREQFKCGYILKIDSAPEAMEGILKEVQNFVPEAAVLEDREDTIALPVNDKIPQLLQSLDNKREQLGIEDYAFSVEQLEDVLLRILETN